MSCRAPWRGGKDRLRLAMPPDLDKYRRFVDGYDLDETQKTELIHTLWTIMESFADQAFGLHPAQQVPATRPAGDSTGKTDHLELKDHKVADQFGNAVGSAQRGKDRL